MLTLHDNWKEIVTDSDFQFGKIETIQLTGGTALVQRFGNYPNLDGSTVSVPMAIEFARQHLKMTDEDIPGFVAFSTTHVAYENLIRSQPTTFSVIQSKELMLDFTHPVDLIIVTPPSQEELAFAEKSGVEMILEPVCYDAFVFITGQDNPVDSLTAEQVRDIYSGKITNWKEVGGADSDIRAFQREPNSGSQTAMENLVMKGRKIVPPETFEIIAGMGSLVETVAEYENSRSSLGYTYNFYLETLYRHENIKVLQIDGIPPTAENLRSGLYPFTANYFAVIRAADREKTGGKFMDWMLSDEGQQCIEQAGYVPIRQVDSAP